MDDTPTPIWLRCLTAPFRWLGISLEIVKGETPIYRWKGPTEKWVRDPSLDLVVDLDVPSLCGVGLGEPVQRLRALGPATCSEFAVYFESREGGSLGRLEQKHELDYRGLGLVCTYTRDWRLDSFRIHLCDDAELEATAFTGVVLFAGQVVHFTNLASREAVQGTFGSPQVADAHEDTELGSYEHYVHGRAQIMVDYSPLVVPRVIHVSPARTSEPQWPD